MAGRFSVEAVFKAVDRVTAPVSRMQQRMQKFTRSMTRGLRKANKAVGTLVKGMARGLGTIAKFGGVLLGAVTGAVVLALNNAADAADHLAKQSRRLDFPIEDLQEWKFVSEQAGVSSELLDKSLGAFSKRLGEAAGGMGPLVSGLKKINPGLLAQLQNTKSIAKAFEIYIDAIRNADSATEKAALANAAFSRSGLALVNIADNSSAAIAALRKEQRENGVITAEQALLAEQYNDALNSLQRSLRGMLQAALLPMLPAITETVRAWREWVVANKELVTQKVQQFVEGVKSGIKSLITAAREMDLAERLGEVVAMARQASVFLKENGATILKVTAAVVALSVGLNTLVAVMTLVNIVMALNPVGLIVIGVLALVAAFAALVVWIDDIDAGLRKMTGVVGFLLTPLKALVAAIKFVKDNSGFVSSIGASLGFGGDGEDGADGAGAGGAPPQVVSPQDRVARSIEERRETSTAEVTLRDETGRAEVTGGSLGGSVTLLPSGAL